MIEPEGERESQLLTELAGGLKFDRPSGMQDRIPSGSSESGSDGLFELLVGNKETRPSSLTVKSNHQQKVIRIDKLL